MTRPVAFGPSTPLLVAITVAVSALVGNMYYTQPIVSSIAPDLGIAPNVAGSVVGVTQVGYGLGLLLLVPLADATENRRLTLLSLCSTAAALLGVAVSTTAASFFAAALLVGLCITGTQVLLPFVSFLVPIERRGRVLGNVLAGVLTGIMLARPFSLFMTAWLGWRAVFVTSAALMVGMALVLLAIMPERRPQGGLPYREVLWSMGRLARDTPSLRWRALAQASLFGAFDLFWTSMPFLLRTSFGLDQTEIGWFALAGAGGAFAAPIAGRLADRGHGTAASAFAVAVLILSFLASIWAASAAALIALVLLAIDAAVQAGSVISQRVVLSTSEDVRGRANAIFVMVQYVAAAAGSVIATIAWHAGGWRPVALIGAAAGTAALLFLEVERRRAGRGQGASPLPRTAC